MVSALERINKKRASSYVQKVITQVANDEESNWDEKVVAFRLFLKDCKKNKLIKSYRVKNKNKVVIDFTIKPVTPMKNIFINVMI